MVIGGGDQLGLLISLSHFLKALVMDPDPSAMDPDPSVKNLTLKKNW